MDSFYDAPRRAPIPTQIEKFHPAPAVPEVSIICAPKPFANKYCWKMQQDGIESVGNLTSKGDNLLKERKTMNSYQNSSIQNTSQILKKQVRFESPILQQRPSLTYEPFNTKQGVTQENVGNAPIVTTKCSKTDEVTNLQQRENRFLAGRTFQELHLANVPNRHLDLSLIDLPKKTKRKIISSEENTKDTGSCKTNLNKNQHNEQKESLHNDKENMLPKTYREFLETQKKIRENEKANGSITDILNYKRKEFYSESRTDKISRDLINEPNLTNSKDFKCEPPLMSRDYTSKPNLTESKALTVEPNRMKSIESDVKITSNLINTHISKYNYSGDSKFHTDNQPMQMPLLENKMYSDFRRQNIECYETTGQPQKCDRIIQTSIADVSTSKPDKSLKRVETAKDDTEPTNRDLLKIIAQQNEQLLILQKQVAMLLNKEDQQNHKRIEAAHCYEQNYVGEKCVTSTQNEIFRSPLQDVHNTPRKQPLSKFSIDLMTSFEVAIRPQHIKQNFINQEPKIQEITESESIKDNMSAVDKNDKTLVDTSIHLQEPVKVREMCPSPEPSININMNDYDSSDDDEITASEIGATFYRNLMGQVNDILGKAQMQTKADLKDGQNCVDKFKNETMKRVKEATLKHLQNIGVTIRPTEEVDEQMRFVNNNANYSPTEISFAVKQLLMKYLPDDQLAKITFKQTQSVPFDKKTKAGIIPNRPEFSFASVEYMKKYNIISNNTDIKSAENEQVAKTANPQRQDGPKILDITALKMQPKLL